MQKHIVPAHFDFYFGPNLSLEAIKNLPALIQTKCHYVEMTRALIYLFKSTSFILGDLWLLIMYLKNKMSFMENADHFFSGQLCIFLP